jgi:glutamate---cysteine ligase / carboxylate-amine ligase
MTARRFGVEEELLLVDPETRLLTGVSESAVAASASDVDVSQELFEQQIETATTPCTNAEQLFTALRSGRRVVGESAAAVGARAVAVASAPLQQDTESFTTQPRIARIRTEFGETARQSMICAMHVHVEVPDQQEAVAALDGLRPWLPLLVALSANSPFWQGRDTGYASWRTQVISRWPTAGGADPFVDMAGYRETVRMMLEWGGGLDSGMVYFDARLSESYPTVEIRVADVCTDLEDALLVAMLARALVDTCGRTAPVPWRSDLLRVAAWRAARYGLSSTLVHPVERTLAAPREVLHDASTFCADSLDAAGDREHVGDLVERLMARGTGATRQRRVAEARSGELSAVVDDVADRTEQSWSSSTP